jgi:hypothetical protein
MEAGSHKACYNYRDIFELINLRKSIREKKFYFLFQKFLDLILKNLSSIEFSKQ